MTSTPPEAPSGSLGPAPDDPAAQRPRVTRDEVRDLGRLRRTTADRHIAGVAGGLARHLDIDPVIVRVAFVVLVFFGGAGLVLYAACWLLVPADDEDRAPFALDERSRGIALVLVGALAILLVLGDTWGDRQWLGWPLIVVGVVALVFFGRRRPDPAAPGGPAPLDAASTPAYDPAYGPAYDPAYGPAYDPAYDPADGPAPVYGAPAAYDPFPVAPRNPRRRGPVLFWFTLALVALLEGLLGTADLAGVAVADAAYPALAVATIGGMLLVGAFYGRAGGLVLLGLVATAALAGATATDQWEGEDVRRTPVRAAEVQSGYRISTGELVLDLRSVHDVEALDGRTVRLRGDAGRLEVLVPPGLDVDVRASIDGPGNISLFGEEHGGIDLSVSQQSDGGALAPALTIDAGLGVGQIEVHP